MPHLRSGLLADLLNLLELLVGGLLCVLLGLLVAAGVLFAVSHCPKSISFHHLHPLKEQSYESLVRLTSDSKVLNSDSFCDL